MTNIVEAEQKIREEKERGGGNLTLDNLGLTSKDLAQLIPIINQELPNLTDLSLDNNIIESLPDSIGSLSNLYYLYLSNNNITIVPDSIENLSNLRYLYLNNNNITTLPDTIGNLSNLKWLDLDNNNITIVPDSIGNLSNLKWLNLDNNKIKFVPDSIGNLSNLNQLNLNNNNLESLHDSIGNHDNLIVLFLNNNNFTIVPEAIANLPYLRNMVLSENPLSLESLLTISAINNSQKIFHLNQEHRDTLNQILEQPSTGVKNIARSIANDYPATSISEFNTLYHNLSTYQILGISEFELPLSELGIGLDSNGNLSNQLTLRITDDMRLT